MAWIHRLVLHRVTIAMADSQPNAEEISVPDAPQAVDTVVDVVATTDPTLTETPASSEVPESDKSDAESSESAPPEQEVELETVDATLSDAASDEEECVAEIEKIPKHIVVIGAGHCKYIFNARTMSKYSTGCNTHKHLSH